MLCGMTAPVDEFMRSAVKARQRAQSALTKAVQEARAAGWSWDRISTALGDSPKAESLRLAFGVGERADEQGVGGCYSCGGDEGCTCTGCHSN
jgi:hypothetical protein